ncbi:MAG: NDP-hexose 4-ketoreductase, partial [Candidatus Nanopelagicales bacterium]
LDERLKDRDISLDLTQSARELLAERGYDTSMGARPLRRTIQREIEDPLSEKMLFGEIVPGSAVLVDVIDGGDGKEFTFTSTPKADVPDLPPVETAGTD